MFEQVSYRDRANHLGPVLEVVHCQSYPDLARFTTVEMRMSSF